MATFTATLGQDAQIFAGATDDFLYLQFDAFANAGDVFDGGAGTDTIQIRSSMVAHPPGGGATWVAQALSDMDYIVRTYHGDLRPKLGHMPSEYWNRQCYTSFIVDPPAMELVDRIGAHTMMWGSDYPHAEGTWTYSGEVAQSIWDAVGPEKGAMILGGNAARLWNL